MQQPIDPLVDCVFRLLFGSRINKRLSIAFINALLHKNTSFDPIVDAVVVGPDVDCDFIENATTTDIHLQGYTATNKRLLVSLRLAIHPGSPERMLFAWNGLLPPTVSATADCVPHICIWVLREVLFPAPNPHLIFRPWCQESHALLSSDSAIHVLQMPVAAKNQRIRSEADRWLYFLTHARDVTPNALPEWMRTPEMQAAFAVLQTFEQDESMYQCYLRRLEQRLYESSIFKECQTRKLSKRAS